MINYTDYGMTSYLTIFVLRLSKLNKLNIWL